MIKQSWIDLILKYSHPEDYPVIVGGFVRDSVWLNNHTSRRSTTSLAIAANLKSKCDYDIAVKKDALVLAKKLAKALKGVFVLLDEEHACARIVLKDENAIVTLDISNYRDKTLSRDLAKRDFTVNSLYIPLKVGLNKDNLIKAVKDPRGGLEDIKEGLIVMNNEGVFKDDPLRLLRAFTLMAQFNWRIERKTLKAIEENQDLIRLPARERVRDEMFKIMASPRATVTLRLMDRLGLLERIIPQIAVMKGVEQGGYHHLDVWQHSLQVLEEMEKLLVIWKKNVVVDEHLQQVIGGGHSRETLLKWACLWHDIGKPDTKRWEKGRFTFHGHEHVGASIVRHIARQWRLTVKELHCLEDLVRLHLRPGYLSNFAKPSAKAMYRYMRDTQDEAMTLALLAKADQRATCGPLTKLEDAKHHDEICDLIIDACLHPPTENVVRKKDLITGHHLLTLGLKPSPYFGEILTATREAQALEEFKDEQGGLLWVKQWMEKHPPQRVGTK